MGIHGVAVDLQYELVDVAMRGLRGFEVRGIMHGLQAEHIRGRAYV